MSNINISKPIIEKEEIKAVIDVLKSGNIIQGVKTKILEQNFAKFCGTKYALAFNSGTAAIHAGLYALGIGAGDEVITTPFTFVATANPILMQGSKVIFADISEEDFCIDPIEIEKKITKNTKAVIPVDLFGQICDFAEIKKIAKKYKLNVLEDACQAIGATQKDKMAGSFGDIGAFSLYATKNIMCGEGGLITTNNPRVLEKCKMFRHHGQSEKTRYEYFDLGYNYRITDLLAAMAIVQLKKADSFNKKRIENAKKYNESLTGIEGVILPKPKKDNKHVYHQYTIRITKSANFNRSELIDELKKFGITTGIYYPKPLHLHPHFNKLGYKKGDFPVAEKIAEEVLSLPVHPSLNNNEIEKVINTIIRFNKRKRK